MLAEQFQVSRGPIREAVQRLIQEGLVRTVLNRGVYVAELDGAGVRDVYLARTTVERDAVAAIVGGTSGKTADVLEERLRELFAAVDDDGDTLTDAGLAFHAALVDLGGSPRLRRMHETLLIETRLCLGAAKLTCTRPAQAFDEHLAIVRAIRTGNQLAARAAIEEHLTDAVRRLTRNDGAV